MTTHGCAPGCPPLVPHMTHVTTTHTRRALGKRNRDVCVCLSLNNSSQNPLHNMRAMHSKSLYSELCPDGAAGVAARNETTCSRGRWASARHHLGGRGSLLDFRPRRRARAPPCASLRLHASTVQLEGILIRTRFGLEYIKVLRSQVRRFCILILLSS